jgi:cellobiose-specific phosphotransferase system component IIA
MAFIIKSGDAKRDIYEEMRLVKTITIIRIRFKLLKKLNQFLYTMFHKLLN